MKNKLKLALPVVLAMAVVITACNKNNSETADVLSNTAVTQNALSTGAIAIATTNSTSKSAADSVYAVNACSKGSRPDSIAFSSLPVAVGTYLSANYNGYTASKAFKIDSAGTTTGYVVAIQYNSKPVALKFDANGNFAKVLEQREGRDLQGPGGYHDGGMFEGRGGKQKDTVALTALPAGVQSYLSANYTADTLVKAFKNSDNSLVVISKNNGIFATTFSSAGTFIQRMELPARKGKANAVAQSALPAGVATYLTATYPNYVFKYAFALQQNNVLQGYVVVIDANNTKYAVQFDATGVFVKAATIR